MSARPADSAPRRRARAFGLEISLNFDAPGLADAVGPPAGPHTRVGLVDRAAIDRDWPGTGTRRVLEESFGGARPERTIDAHPRAGYRLYARHFGLARLSAQGARVMCSPPGVAAWRWQRFLVGRILPWAAVLRGLEALHASAVVVDGGAIAFVGPTGAGKTSLAVQMVARGASFATDDVLALDRRHGVLRAHPGAALVAVRPAERAAVGQSTWRRVGSVIGRSGKTYMAVPRVKGPVPLRAVYFLTAADGPAVEPIRQPDPRLLLGNTFVVGVQTPERLRRQLDVCSAIVRSVPLFELRRPPGVGSEQLAAIVHEHASATPAAPREDAA
jgi:hypothetical protein